MYVFQILQIEKLIFYMKFINLLVIIFISVATHAQNSYLIDNDSIQIQVTLKAGNQYNNHLLITELTDSSSKTHIPDDILEYQLNNGRTYITKEITIDTVRSKYFLERKYNGKLKLYQLKTKEQKYLYLENDTIGIILLSDDKEELRNQIAEITRDRLSTQKASYRVTNRLSSLKLFCQYYDSCSRNYFPMARKEGSGRI